MAIIQFPDEHELNTQFAWELYKVGKHIFEEEKVDVQNARRLLAEYIKLKNERPSLLHSLFLRFADRITDREEFNLISFLKLWDLSNLTEDDFKPYINGDKTYPSIAEKVIQHGAKLILDKRLTQDVDFFLPYVGIGVERFPDNIWLPFYKAKLLHLIKRNTEAIAFLTPVVKEKISDFWVWSLLAELILESDIEIAISCYCKSLLCKGEDKFIANVRIKMAVLLIQKELWSEAKFEIASAIAAKEAEDVTISDKLRSYQNSDWYKTALDKKSNIDYYILNKQPAEEFIFHSLPWLEGVLGDTFTVADKPDKPRRKVFIKLQDEIIEVVISDRKFNTTRNFSLGDSLKIKGEYNKGKIFQVYLLEKRSSKDTWDIFEWKIGNVIQTLVGTAEKITAYRISAVVDDQLKEGIIDVRAIKSKMQIYEGVPVYVKLYYKEKPTSTFSFVNEKESRVNILSISERIDGQLWDSFPEQIGIVDHINIEKGIAHFIVSRKVSGTIKLNLIKEPLQIGTRVRLKLKKIVKEKEIYYSALTCNHTSEEPKENLVRSFSGVAKLTHSAGFADDVYIENSLLAENQIQDGNFISGTAILHFNKKKGNWGWKAINVSDVI